MAPARTETACSPTFSSTSNCPGCPEMLFTVSRVEGADGQAEFVFVGRGWGHGVGLCQVGAFGMAQAGSSYEAILRHYYSGIALTAAAN